MPKLMSTPAREAGAAITAANVTNEALRSLPNLVMVNPPRTRIGRSPP